MDMPEKNVLIEPIRGRKIVFDTIHGVKGETHDATLYLETDMQGASDLNRILPYFGVGRCQSSNPVSYTHLTLPTIYSVYISGVAASLKKNRQSTLQDKDSIIYQ